MMIKTSDKEMITLVNKNNTHKTCTLGPPACNLLCVQPFALCVQPFVRVYVSAKNISDTQKSHIYQHVLTLLLKYYNV